MACRRPVWKDCVRHQVVRASGGGFPDGRVARHSRGLRREGGVCGDGAATFCTFRGLIRPPVSAAKIPFPGAMVRVRGEADLVAPTSENRVPVFGAISDLSRRIDVRMLSVARGDLQAKGDPLVGPGRRKVHQSLQPEAARKPSLDRRFNKGGVEEGEGKGLTDRPFRSVPRQLQAIAMVRAGSAMRRSSDARAFP